MSSKILLIDDDSFVLQSYSALRDRFDLVMATRGEEGLEAIEEQGPFAVVVSDMRMPEMDGIELLKAVREISPDTVRMMLTSLDDQKTASDAVNEGHIFRFLAKPCSPGTLALALTAGLEQY